MVKEETLPKGFVSEYISLDTKSYNAIKQAYRKLSKSVISFSIPIISIRFSILKPFL